MTSILKKQTLYDLSAIGYSIIYLPDYELCILHNSSVFHNPSNHIYGTTITGKDITGLLENFAANFIDRPTIDTAIDKVPVKTYYFDQNLRFIWIK